MQIRCLFLCGLLLLSASPSYAKDSCAYTLLSTYVDRLVILHEKQLSVSARTKELDYQKDEMAILVGTPRGLQEVVQRFADAFVPSYYSNCNRNIQGAGDAINKLFTAYADNFGLMASLGRKVLNITTVEELNKIRGAVAEASAEQFRLERSIALDLTLYVLYSIPVPDLVADRIALPLTVDEKLLLVTQIREACQYVECSARGDKRGTAASMVAIEATYVNKAWRLVRPTEFSQ